MDKDCKYCEKKRDLIEARKRREKREGKKKLNKKCLHRLELIKLIKNRK